MIETTEINPHTDLPVSTPLSNTSLKTNAQLTPLDQLTPNEIPFLQLNCHVLKEITLTLLHHSPTPPILLLQEPWVNPFTLLPPSHADWHLITSYLHKLANWRDRHKCCIYIHKAFPSEAIAQLPGGSKHIIGVQIQTKDQKTINLVNIYNPPKTNTGLDIYPPSTGLRDAEQPLT